MGGGVVGGAGGGTGSEVKTPQARVTGTAKASTAGLKRGADVL